MKPQNNTLFVAAAAAGLLLLTTGVAQAYYNPQTGRWLSRDPAGEPGFELLRSVGAAPRVASAAVAALPQGRWFNRDPLGETQRISPTSTLRPAMQADAEDEPAVRPGDVRVSESSYGFVDNDSVNTVDCLGLLKFKGCTPDEQSKLSSQFTEYCNKMKRQEFACCVGHFNIPQRLRGMCDNQADITIKCVHNYTRMCDPGTCSWSYPGSQTIRMCPDGLSQSGLCSDPYGCHLVHELTHMIGHPFEKWPMKVEHCLGCKY